eukprot:6198346-Pleurochrysis_carterae.AAC.4
MRTDTVGMPSRRTVSFGPHLPADVHALVSLRGAPLACVRSTVQTNARARTSLVNARSRSRTPTQ